VLVVTPPADPADGVLLSATGTSTTYSRATAWAVVALVPIRVAGAADPSPTTRRHRR
jgi:hypothetical protein